MVLNCPDCRSAVAEDDRFCGECGRALGGSASPTRRTARRVQGNGAHKAAAAARHGPRDPLGKDEILATLEALTVMPPGEEVRLSARAALSELTAACKANPEFVEAHVGRAAAYHLLFENQAALEALDMAFAAGFTQDPCPAIAFDVTYEDGEEIVVELDRDWAMIVRAACLISLHRVDEALAVVEQAFAIGIHDAYTADIHGLHAIVLIHLDRIEEARESCHAASDWSQPSVFEAESRAMLARVDGRYEEWRDALTEALAIDPGDVELLTMRIDSHLANEDIESAKADREEAARILERIGAPRERVTQMRNWVV